MRFSVVINTYNRGHCLGRALEGLDRQTHDDFEVIVVNGPSTDDTDALLARHAGRLRVGRCPDVNISKSRNVGIDMAAGDVVAFLDDDAVPEPRWLSDLAEAYQRPEVGGVGGATYDFNGRHFQFRNGVSNRLGEAVVNLDEPLWSYQIPGADPFACLLGANSSFRRDDLLSIGGFDEEIEYYLDETDICVRLNDLGRVIESVDSAFVHHHYQPSHLRAVQKYIRHPFPVIKNKLYFALTHGRPRYSIEEILADARHLADQQRTHASQFLDRDELKGYLREIEQGLEVGLERGLRGERQSGRLRDHDQIRDDFLLYPTLRPGGRRLCVCFVSQEYPPERYGGIGRFTHDMAAGLSELGHEIHVITATHDEERTDYQRGVWVHRIQESHTDRPELAHSPIVRRNLNRGFAVYDEVRRIAEHREIDVVQAPIWDCEGAICQLDDRWRNVLSLQTTAAVAARLNPDWGATPAAQGALALERFTLGRHDKIHTISRDILQRVEADHGLRFDPAHVGLVPLGLPDRTSLVKATTRPADAPVRVTFVGRLEKRKGIDVFLNAAAIVARRRSDVEFHVVGDDTLKVAPDGRTYREAFEESVEPGVLSRFHFTGRVEEAELDRHYAECDVFCAPSRYESFGLVFVEAMAFAKPVIGCDAGGVPEVVAHEENGLLVPPDDPDALADAVERLVVDQPLRARLGRRSRERYLSQFTQTVMAGAIETFYQRIA